MAALLEADILRNTAIFGSFGTFLPPSHRNYTLKSGSKCSSPQAASDRIFNFFENSIYFAKKNLRSWSNFSDFLQLNIDPQPWEREASRSSAQWLYNHCNQLRTAIGTNKSTIDLANIAVKALMKIKDENKEQVCTKITYLTIIRNAFRARAIGGSVTDAFINGLADKCDELIDDENEDELNECELNKIVSM